MFSYDGALGAAAGEDPRTIADVLGTLRGIDGICSDRDGLKWFNRLYLSVTEAVDAQVRLGGFRDPGWLSELDVQFARLYLRALGGWLRGEAVPSCWRVMLAAREQALIARVQFALAGVNAHINHDLPAAVVATCRVRGTEPAHGCAQYSDYTAVNGTLEELIDSAKRELRLRLVGDVLPPVSHVEDTIAGWKMAAARESAWWNAEHLWAVRDSRLLPAGFERMLDGFATVIGKALLVPVPLNVIGS